MAYLVKESDGKFSIMSGKDDFVCVDVLNKKDFIQFHSEFLGYCKKPFITRHFNNGKFSGYVAGYNAEVDNISVEICIGTTRGSLRVFKTIETAAAFLCNTCMLDESVELFWA